MTKLFALFFTLIPTMALAHHPMGGETPGTFMQGLLSGLGHPVIGFDHLAFVVAAGIAAAFTTKRVANIAGFAMATVAGCALFMNGVTLPFLELVITASGVVIGGLVLTNTRVPNAALLSLFSIAGLFHGSAYADAIIGAQAEPLIAYLIGFAGIQALIAYGAGALVKNNVTSARLAGAVCAGVALAFFVENVEAMLFAAA